MGNSGEEMNILIIGKGSYIGTSIKKYIGEEHVVREFDSVGGELTDSLFESVDCVVHVAAIVHRKDVKDYTAYKSVNVDLPYKVATIAKKNKVKQFVFFSSMAVYGVPKSLNGNIINSQTVCMPSSHYGRSKYEAESEIEKLRDNSFAVSIIRPANVYGKNCSGNYMKLIEKIVRHLPFIPKAYEDAKQGFIYIDNLCELVRLIINNRSEGVFLAQDEPVSAVRLMEEISHATKTKRKARFGKRFLFLFPKRYVVKLYGGVAYDPDVTKTAIGDYCVKSFSQGIAETFGEFEAR